MKRKARYMLKFTITPEILLTTKDFVIFLTKKNKILISDDQTLIIVEIKNDKKEKSFAF
ncbi:hypothetical protein [Photobacterium damselae]|nr:hypothetical protein [Photobacterium damselae]UKA08353.1 hypothetical protein IHC90_15095 [Photobacterium damselae subsp. damselae]